MTPKASHLGVSLGRLTSLPYRGSQVRRPSATLLFQPKTSRKPLRPVTLEAGGGQVDDAEAVRG